VEGEKESLCCDLRKVEQEKEDLRCALHGVEGEKESLCCDLRKVEQEKEDLRCALHGVEEQKERLCYDLHRVQQEMQHQIESVSEIFSLSRAGSGQQATLNEIESPEKNDGRKASLYTQLLSKLRLEVLRLVSSEVHRADPYLLEGSAAGGSSQETTTQLTQLDVTKDKAPTQSIDNTDNIEDRGAARAHNEHTIKDGENVLLLREVQYYSHHFRRMCVRADALRQQVRCSVPVVCRGILTFHCLKIARRHTREYSHRSS
jgi:hypothetical protein